MQVPRTDQHIRFWGYPRLRGCHFVALQHGHESGHNNAGQCPTIVVEQGTSTIARPRHDGVT